MNIKISVLATIPKRTQAWVACGSQIFVETTAFTLGINGVNAHFRATVVPEKV